MKQTIVFCALVLSGICCVSAQNRQYIMLDMLDSLAKHDSGYQLNRYTLNAKELYGVDETIELYNFHDVGLALFSVLPDFTSDSNWSEVDIAAIQAQIFDEKSFLRMVSTHVSSERNQDKKSLQYTLVKQEDGQYFKSNFCLAEFFFMDDYPSLFNVPYGTINTQQDALSIKDMKNVYWDSLNIPEQQPFPMDVRLIGSTLMLPNRPLLQREYLSRKLILNNQTAYKFWTFTDWNTHDSYNLHRGIDRFIYLPGKGIVGGSYDFYFLFVDTWTYPPKERQRHTKTPDELWQNVLEEKVMLAEELK